MLSPPLSTLFSVFVSFILKDNFELEFIDTCTTKVDIIVGRINGNGKILENTTEAFVLNRRLRFYEFFREYDIFFAFTLLYVRVHRMYMYEVNTF